MEDDVFCKFAVISLLFEQKIRAAENLFCCADFFVVKAFPSAFKHGRETHTAVCSPCHGSRA